MSFILDALKKSESERQRQAGPALLEARIVRPSRRPPVWAIAIGLLLLINFGVVAWLLAHSSAAAPAARPPPAAAPAPSITAPSTGPLPATAAPARDAPTGAAPSLSGGLARMVAPPVSPATAPATSAAAASGSAAADTTGTINPADLEPAVAPATGTSASSGNSGLRNYAELAGTLPQLRLDLHVYANNPAERYAFINMRKVREGDVTPEGVRVSQITREGVVLDYRGTEFLLGRE
jgi:general secretion pathway protein B